MTFITRAVRPFVESLIVLTLLCGAGCDETSDAEATDASVDDATSDDASSTHPNTVRVPDGGALETSCTAVAIDASACGVDEGRPVYGYYDGCNWVHCFDGSRATTARACDPDTIPFTENDCVAVYFGTTSVDLPEGETWVCDASGQLFRSACAPSMTTPVK